MRVLVPYSTGVEEIELVAIVDILRRSGAEVVTAALHHLETIGRSQLHMRADVLLKDVLSQAWDMVVLPGGLPNAYHLRDHVELKKLVQGMHAQQKYIAAICAAPLALAAYGVTQGQYVTSFPALESELRNIDPSLNYQQASVVVDQQMVTSRGAGTAIEFSLALVKQLFGVAKAEAIRTEIVCAEGSF